MSDYFLEQELRDMELDEQEEAAQDVLMALWRLESDEKAFNAGFRMKDAA